MAYAFDFCHLPGLFEVLVLKRDMQSSEKSCVTLCHCHCEVVCRWCMDSFASHPVPLQKRLQSFIEDHLCLELVTSYSIES